MKKLLAVVGISCILCLSACSFIDGTKEKEASAESVAMSQAAEQNLLQAPVIVDKPIKWTSEREKLIREYSLLHYGKEIMKIEPQAVVVHWTVTKGWKEVYHYFYNETMANTHGGRLNVASHFLVARDGTIYRLTEETAMNRHAIGYNWCAIGIENVGGVDGREDLTAEQLKSNIALIRYLEQKYPTICYVWGHYQQNKAKESGLYIEHQKGYYSAKIDPGPKFMRSLREGLADTDLKFFAE